MENAIQKLLVERYFLSDENSWKDLSIRVSKIYPEALDLIESKTLVPSSPTLMNANTNGQRKGTLSSCFTMGITDSIEGIMDSLKEAAIVTKASGGVGYVFSQLRSSKEGIKGLDGRLSSGPLPFANMFNAVLDGVQQGGARRGAGMFQFDITSPDILDVIRVKDKKGNLERFNISIRVTDEFYSKLKQNPDFPHIVYFKDGSSYPLEDKGEIVTVGKLWNEMIEYAWRCAEPGIFNIDIATRQCSVTNLDPVVLSNPCSEFVQIQYSSCNLASLNLVNFIENGIFNWDKFYLAIKIATRFLDSVIDINDFPIKKIEEVTKKVRPLGLGIMGLAHALYTMKIPYSSKEGSSFIEKIFHDLTIQSTLESIEMAKEKGSYEAFDCDTYLNANERILKNHPEIIEDIKKYGIRNSTQTSQAPTGSISFIANVSSGIEPVFALTYARKIEKLNKEYEIVYISDPIFDKYLSENFDEKTKEKILKQVADSKGSCQKVEEIPEDIRKVFVVASDLTPMEHLEALALGAKSVNTSISKTINLPAEATREEISEVYLKAHELGVIGVTVYRDGCRDGILVHQTDKNDEEVIVKTNAPKRPKSLPCHVYKMNILNRQTSESEKWIVFVGLLKNEPYEIIAGKIGDVDIPSSITEGEIVKSKKNGKKVYQFIHEGEVLVADICGVFMNGLREYSTRLMSLALRHGAGIEYLKDVLEKSDGTVVDFNKAIIRGINRYMKDVKSKEKCPSCNAELIYIEGCVKCSNIECGFSKCG